MLQITDKNSMKNRTSMMSRNSRVSKFTLATKQFKFMDKAQTEDYTLQSSQVMDSQVLKDRINIFFSKGMLLLFSHIFDMSIQKQDGYKLVGQTNLIMRKLNNLFKVDKTLINDFKKNSSIINHQIKALSSWISLFCLLLFKRGKPSIWRTIISKSRRLIRVLRRNRKV